MQSTDLPGAVEEYLGRLIVPQGRLWPPRASPKPILGASQGPDGGHKYPSGPFLCTPVSTRGIIDTQYQHLGVSDMTDLQKLNLKLGEVRR